ncbi:ATP-binding cassette domain-containing protein [Streptomyces sp. SID5473]|uniref:Daunorubicin ABC transporter ATP-binding protein n=1 Tax=Streptomyces tsukubensis (strain DSM 42081 / NBRC 108919 / NRRL 18488 / 9993) TaxID=1114943 RepID=A0A7G3UP69_STRT9|nr:ATP-binding cassette domain-containing protein [Streptomyces sp. SID5473]QKM72026.1 daunorubicin ABC transporter ATP-binding protein [Streptomyces tsukubensis NRRL18488]TAI41851.1 ATP-binding cassette domain-containing protein [Streptomyces tsukubensis]
MAAAGRAVTAPGAPDVIRTEALRKVYPGTDFAAVDGIGLRVRQGEFFGLLGPNGAGKTTTVGMLTGRVVPTSGSAYVGTVDVVRQPALAKQIIACVTQQNTLDRALTVRENLYFHGLLFGIPRKESLRRADELLERFALARWRDASVYALSGGMAQRLMLARAVFHRPAVLFLDEPTAGLDPQGRLALWEALDELIADGRTILLTTHNMEEADQLCDRVAIVDHGRILALDTPAALKRGLGADTTVTVVARGRAEELAHRLEEDIPEVVRTRLTDGGVELQVSGNDRLVPRVVASAEAGGFELVDLSLSQSTLETVFISLTGKELRE